MISFLIVNWNGGEIFVKCLQSIERNMGLLQNVNYEIVVIDNNSYDLHLIKNCSFKNMKIVKNLTNVGFARGTNQSIANAKGDYYFILNNDVILFDDCVKILYEEIEKNENDVVTPLLLYPNGEIQGGMMTVPKLKDLFYASFGLNFLGGNFDRWYLRKFDYNTRQYCNQPMFSCLVIKKNVWENVGIMDENFPILFNDTDWFYRFHKLGYNCLFNPDAKAYHVHGMSTRKNRLRRIYLSTKGLYDFFNKNYPLNLFSKSLLIFIIFWTFPLRLLKEIIRKLINK